MPTALSLLIYKSMVFEAVCDSAISVGPLGQSIDQYYVDRAVGRDACVHVYKRQFIITVPTTVVIDGFLFASNATYYDAYPSIIKCLFATWSKHIMIETSIGHFGGIKNLPRYSFMVFMN